MFACFGFILLLKRTVSNLALIICQTFLPFSLFYFCIMLLRLVRENARVHITIKYLHITTVFGMGFRIKNRKCKIYFKYKMRFEIKINNMF